MENAFYEARGDIVSSSQLKLPKARDLALALEAGSLEYAHLIECRRTSENEEVVVFDVDVEIPQLKVHQIHPLERISVTFGLTDKFVPKTEALRRNFPQVPHLNLHRQEFPRDLCLYAERYEELKRRWTAARFVQNVRSWLARTATGQLHQPDQPLEPILLNYSGHIVLPQDIASNGGAGTPELLYAIPAPSSDENRPFLITHREPPTENAIPFIASIHRCGTQIHGTISRQPDSLEELADLVSAAGLNLIEELRERLKRWKEKDIRHLESILALVILFPKSRIMGGQVESVDTWTFLLDGKIRMLGSKLGIWQDQGGNLGTLLVPDITKRGGDIAVDVLNTSLRLNRSAAAKMNGRRLSQDLTIAAIGMGALGSQVVINLSRSGFGTWTLIDHDLLMPHNLARHALYGPFVGCPKAKGVAIVANTAVADSSRFTALKTDVLIPGNQELTLAECLQKADVILDMSASVALARKLASDIKGDARRLSLFLATAGDDLILLAEDGNRTVTLDAIEMQYYRAVISDRRLKGHMKIRGVQQRYGQSCRDITNTLPQSLVALHAAIGAAALQEIVDRPKAIINVWRCDLARNVRCVEVPLRPVIRHKIGQWTVATDEGLLEKLHTLRRKRLPKETGGVLLGSFDTERRLIYIVDSLPSPEDSEEWPTLYVRGCKGLQRALAQAEESTQHMLEYIGEWHSHPSRTSTAPSNDDLQVFAWLTQLMSQDGLPAVMMIVGDPGRLSCFIGEIKRKENLLPKGPGIE